MKPKYQINDIIMNIKNDPVDKKGTVYKITDLLDIYYRLKYLNGDRKNSKGKFNWAFYNADPVTIKAPKLARLFYT